MKKNILLILTMIIAGLFSQAKAETVEVQTLESFSTSNPPTLIKLRLLNELKLSDEITVVPGSELYGSLVKVVSPKRLKRNAKFSVKLQSYTDADGIRHIIPEDITASYTTTLNKAQLAKSAALGVGNHFVKGLSIGVAAVEGAVNNQEGNRLKSGVKSVYNASPLSYTQKGKDLYFETNDIFYLKFQNVHE